MARNVILETFSFNSFVVNENMNDTNQEPDLNFFHFHESVSVLDTDYVSPKDFKGKSKNYTENFCCFTSKY